ncbi:Sideroflexin-1 [Myotis davidii]|uniref:Sideroflexin-1 n=1 Tax=Myotis davidii TaxID=225400 RepID=L5LS96_MYODS|nr:Sideroflexin-1 [Myotis davidii]
MSGELPPNINIQEPRWDQSTFVGRASHFFTVTDPRNLLLTNQQLEDARKTVHDYRQGVVPPGLTENELWRAKYIYDSAFHPDTGEKMVLIGRMSAQVPMNMTITGCMMTFYRTTPAVLFWQWINQSFNAVVNYTNRSGDAPLTVSELGTAYVSATTGAVATALGLNALTKWINQSFNAVVNYTNRSGDAPLTVRRYSCRWRRCRKAGPPHPQALLPQNTRSSGWPGVNRTLHPVYPVRVDRLPAPKAAASTVQLTSAEHVSPLIGRFVPFAAVAAANCINIPLMRQRLVMGISRNDLCLQYRQSSDYAAQQAIAQVVVSRILMAAPGMAIPPFIMNTLEKKAFLKRFPWMSAPIQVGLVGFCLVFATPLCCALFPQKSSMSVTSLEPELQAKLRESHPELRHVYFNKGL